jgi:hypothetical protein
VCTRVVSGFHLYRHRPMLNSRKEMVQKQNSLQVHRYHLLSPPLNNKNYVRYLWHYVLFICINTLNRWSYAFHISVHSKKISKAQQQTALSSTKSTAVKRTALLSTSHRTWLFPFPSHLTRGDSQGHSTINHSRTRKNKWDLAFKAKFWFPRETNEY